MKNLFKKLVVRGAHLFGLEVRIRSARSRDDLRLSKFLKMFNVDLVLDIGANQGQFAKQLFAAGYDGRIVSFEALPTEHKRLQTAAQKFGGRWIIGPCLALSDKAGSARFHVTAASQSSSLFEPNSTFSVSAPEISDYHCIEVPTDRLDNAFRSLNIPFKNVFIKLDTQGSELLILSGAPDLLKIAKGVMSEVSLRALYNSQPSARDVYKHIAAAGFDLWDIWSGYRDPLSFRLNEADVIFFRPDSASRLDSGAV